MLSIVLYGLRVYFICKTTEGVGKEKFGLQVLQLSSFTVIYLFAR